MKLNRNLNLNPVVVEDVRTVHDLESGLISPRGFPADCYPSFLLELGDTRQSGKGIRIDRRGYLAIDPFRNFLLALFESVENFDKKAED
jgi:hypothetical protein